MSACCERLLLAIGLQVSLVEGSGLVPPRGPQPCRALVFINPPASSCRPPASPHRSCGVILFTLLFGRYPFEASSRDFAKRIVAGQWSMPPEAAALSAECRDMLTRLLAADPARRVDFAGIFVHPWCAGAFQAPWGPPGGA